MIAQARHLQRCCTRAAARFLREHASDVPLIFEALLAAEDHRGLKHQGIDWFSIGRAIYRVPEMKGFKGISTIEQQLVRTIFPRRGVPRWRRKGRECALAVHVAKTLPKTTIWAAYLHCAYYGRDYPTYAHIRRKFIQREASIDVVAAARIVSCLKYPSPHRDDHAWLFVHARRTKYVLRRLTTICQRGDIAALAAHELDVPATDPCLSISSEHGEDQGVALTNSRGR